MIDILFASTQFLFNNNYVTRYSVLISLLAFLSIAEFLEKFSRVIIIQLQEPNNSFLIGTNTKIDRKV